MSSNLVTGIEALSFYSSKHYIELSDLAEARGEKPERFTSAIGQKRMGVPQPGEDSVTLAANAAEQALEGVDKSTVTNLFFATESCVDQSKSAGIYVHTLTGLSHRCRVIEVKQACYSATAMLQMARGYLLARPDEKVLIVASDIARYGLGTAGEPTQGCGAVAILLSTTPKVLTFDDPCGFCVEDVMDFWRPNYRDEALVDGRASMLLYIRCLKECWRQYSEISGLGIEDIDAFCYHLPFSNMAVKAHSSLLKMSDQRPSADDVQALLAPGLLYNQEIGNSYTASLYISICSMLENTTTDLTGRRLGLFSYGSGCMAEFFSATILPGYKDALKTATHAEMLANRKRIDMTTYESYYSTKLPDDGSEFMFAAIPGGCCRLAGIRDHQRIYERIG